MSTQDDLFHPVIELPEPVRADRYARLVGLDDIKDRLRKESALLADPGRLRQWARQHHGGEVAALTLFADRAPLFVFAGDVGAGKTALAESFGCDLADYLNVPVYLYRLKATARGSGLVGEMTTLITDAFGYLLVRGKKASGDRGVSQVLIMVIDEADALAQSREEQHMHHEDRAGVDALLAGVDGLAAARVPVLVLLCTNRLTALDPAVLRRAAATFTFERPTADQRHAVLRQALGGIDVATGTMNKLVDLTGPDGDRPGFTFSDLTQRLIPSAVLRAFPGRPVDDALLLEIAAELLPTPIFGARS